jgi:alkylation response protein AidB-like acyl-CoA dehydrogenase
MQTRDNLMLDALGDVRPAPDPALTADDILKAAEDLVPLLRERAVAADRDRRIELDTYRRLGEAGFFHILKPRKYGGLELSEHEHEHEHGGNDPRPWMRVHRLGVFHPQLRQHGRPGLP